MYEVRTPNMTTQKTACEKICIVRHVLTLTNLGFSKEREKAYDAVDSNHCHERGELHHLWYLPQSGQKLFFSASEIFSILLRFPRLNM